MYLIQMMQLHLMQLVNSLLMKWLNFKRRVAESNKQVEDFSSPEVDETNEVVSTPVDFGIPDTFESEVADFPTSAPVDEDFDLQPESTGEINLNETQTFKLNISE